MKLLKEMECSEFKPAFLRTWRRDEDEYLLSWPK